MNTTGLSPREEDLYEMLVPMIITEPSISTDSRPSLRLTDPLLHSLPSDPTPSQYQSNRSKMVRRHPYLYWRNITMSRFRRRTKDPLNTPTLTVLPISGWLSVFFEYVRVIRRLVSRCVRIFPLLNVGRRYVIFLHTSRTRRSSYRFLDGTGNCQD